MFKQKEERAKDSGLEKRQNRILTRQTWILGITAAILFIQVVTTLGIWKSQTDFQWTLEQPNFAFSTTHSPNTNCPPDLTFDKKTNESDGSLILEVKNVGRLTGGFQFNVQGENIHFKDADIQEQNCLAYNQNCSFRRLVTTDQSLWITLNRQLSDTLSNMSYVMEWRCIDEHCIPKDGSLLCQYKRNENVLECPYDKICYNREI